MSKTITIIITILSLSGCATSQPDIGRCYYYVGLYLVYGDSPAAAVIYERDRRLHPNWYGHVESVIARYAPDRDYRVYSNGQFSREDLIRWIESDQYRVAIAYLKHAEPARSKYSLLLKPITRVYVMLAEGV